MSNGWFSFGKDSPAVKLARIEFDNGYALNIMRDQLPFTIGRAKDRNLVVTSAFVSRRHCTIDAVDGELHIIDDHLLKHESAAIAHRIHLLFGGEFMLAISPHDANGQLIDAPSPTIRRQPRGPIPTVCCWSTCAIRRRRRQSRSAP